MINAPIGYGDYFGGLGIPLYATSDSLLDSFTNITHAYSVSRKLLSSATNAFRVRRSSDNVESDIGFLSNSIDTASLLSFIGANDGFGRTLYDQKASKNINQSVAGSQSRLVNSGSLETVNSYLSLRNSGVTNRYTIVSTNFTAFTLFFVFSTSDTASSTVIARNSSNLDRIIHNNASGNLTFAVDNNVVNTAVNTIPPASNTIYSLCVRYKGTTTDIYLDNTLITSPATTASTFSFLDMFFTVGNMSNTYIMESIICDSSLSDLERNAINLNINSFYGI